MTVDADGDHTVAYAFRVQDVLAAPQVTPGIVVNGDLTPANETDLFRFDVVAGDKFYFDFIIGFPSSS